MKKKTLGGLIGFGVLVAVLIVFGIIQIITIQHRPAKLIEAVRAGRVDEVRALLKAGTPVDGRDEDDYLHPTPLIIAAQLGMGIDMVSVLIDAGADIEAVNEDDSTPLMFASGIHSDREVIKALLAAGADVNLQAGREEFPGYSPLMVAVKMCRDMQVLGDLINAGADMNARLGTGYPVLGLANSPAAISKLIESGVDVNVSKDGWTPLMYYASWDREESREAIGLIVAAGVDIEARDDGGKTALMWAVSRKQAEGVIALLELGADIDARSNDGMTALIYAAQEVFGPACMVALLDAGADVQIRDDAGKTALDYLMENYYFDGTQARERLIEATK